MTRQTRIENLFADLATGQRKGAWVSHDDALALIHHAQKHGRWVEIDDSDGYFHRVYAKID